MRRSVDYEQIPFAIVIEGACLNAAIRSLFFCFTNLVSPVADPIRARCATIHDKALQETDITMTWNPGKRGMLDHEVFGTVHLNQLRSRGQKATRRSCQRKQPTLCHHTRWEKSWW